MTDRLRRFASAGYFVILAACALVSVGWLTIGAIVLVVTYWPTGAAAMAAAAAGGSSWARGVMAAMPLSEPLDQGVVDYAFSALNLAIAVVALSIGTRNWISRLVALAMIGSAGAFNLQADTAEPVVRGAVGLSTAGLHDLLLHGVTCAAFILALLLFPTGRWDIRPRSRLHGSALIVSGTIVFVAVGLATTLLPYALSCVLLFEFLVPLVGLAVLPRRIRQAATAQQRTQARLLFSALAAGFAASAVLEILALLLRFLDEPAMPLADPGGPPSDSLAEPTAPLFWFARLASATIAVAILLSARRNRLWAAERLFSRGLAAILMVALVGGGYVVIWAIASRLIGDERTTDAALAGLATGLIALVFTPLYLRIEQGVDRLLYGSRPTPYSVLADITSFSHGMSTNAPNLAGVAEAIGRGLSASSCRLTVIRPGLRNRTYAWADGTGADGDDLVSLPIRLGDDQIGTVAVDRAAVAGLDNQRRHLLEDIADSLGAIVQASRLGIELERQLRTALAHAEDIALSRRQTVAEMDSERRMIERDLHDGAQHHLVSLRLALGLIEHEVGSQRLAQARDLLGQLRRQVDAAAAVLAETASGVSSTLLDERGLIAALRADLSGSRPPVVVHAPEDLSAHRFPSDVEAAVYFCCLEAVNNARKHAPGAPVEVRISEAANGELRFAVRDEGPGFQPERGTQPSGRGLRNVSARITAVGGRVSIHSAPGAGTTMEGIVPLPEEARTIIATREESRSEKQPSAVVSTESSLLNQVRRVIRETHRANGDAGGDQWLHELRTRLDEPMRVGIVGPARIGKSTLVSALRDQQRAHMLPIGSMTVIDTAETEMPSRWPDTTSAPSADAWIVLMREPHDVGRLDVPRRDDLPRPPLAIGVLARADELGTDECADWSAEAARAARECARDPRVRRLCLTVIPTSGLVAAAAVTLREAEYRSLCQLSQLPMDDFRELAHSAATFTRPGTSGDVDESTRRALRHRFGLAGIRLAVDLIRTGQAPTTAALVEAMLRRSGLFELRELLAAQFAPRASALKARSALLALDAVARSSAIGADREERLRHSLERIQANAHELTEIDLIDQLRSGALPLTQDERSVAERLLGAAGTAPTARLGLAAEAENAEVRRAAGVQLVRWQRHATHPASTRAVRDAADTLVRTCEELLSRPSTG